MSESNGKWSASGTFTWNRVVFGAVVIGASLSPNWLGKVSGNEDTPEELPSKPTRREQMIDIRQYYDSLGNAGRIRQLEIDITEMKVRLGICEKELDLLRKIDRKD